MGLGSGKRDGTATRQGTQLWKHLQAKVLIKNLRRKRKEERKKKNTNFVSDDLISARISFHHSCSFRDLSALFKLKVPGLRVLKLFSCPIRQNKRIISEIATIAVRMEAWEAILFCFCYFKKNLIKNNISKIIALSRYW